MYSMCCIETGTGSDICTSVHRHWMVVVCFGSCSFLVFPVLQDAEALNAIGVLT